MLIPLSDIISKYNIQPKGALHIGASTGQEADDYYACGMQHSLWVEAIPEVYKKLLAHIVSFPNARAINACVGDVDGKEVVFHIANNDGQSSSMLEFGTHSKMHPTVKFTSEMKMVTRRMDSLIDENNLEIDNLDFLNIDLQGAELMALKGLGDYLEGFDYAYIEVNVDYLYKGCPLIWEVDEYLAKFGFERKETKLTSWSWGDSFYIKQTK